tara:strand:- start:622 stop:1641 length:1020 start_codon:yes stop_codon:yes gene_type:complete
MIKLFKYNLGSNSLTKSHSYELFTIEDRRYTTMIDVVEKYKNTEKNIAFIECNSLILKCLQYVNTSKFTKSYDKVIIWTSELYWDSCDDEDYINKILDNNVHIIFNFFREDSPFKLKTKSYCSIGSFGDITQMYLNKYNFKINTNTKYNLISKFGRPNPHRRELYNKLKDLPNFVYSINNFPYVENDEQLVSKTFESEKNLNGDFKSYHLPDEDFESFAELITETRLSQFEESKRLVSATEKILKGFMFKRPNITIAQTEVYSYLENFGFKFPNILGMDSKTQQFEICEKITSLSKQQCKDIILQNKDVYESNFNVLVDFLKHHRNKFDDIVKEIIYDN